MLLNRGVRATHLASVHTWSKQIRLDPLGVSGGRHYFECELLPATDHMGTYSSFNSRSRHARWRVGWSLASLSSEDAAVCNLGDAYGSFGYDSSGHLHHASEVIFTPDSEAGPGDRIGCMVDCDNGTIGFSRNGTRLPVLLALPAGISASLCNGADALVPHVAVRAAQIRLQVRSKLATSPGRGSRGDGKSINEETELGPDNVDRLPLHYSWVGTPKGTSNQRYSTAISLSAPRL